MGLNWKLSVRRVRNRLAMLSSVFAAGLLFAVTSLAAADEQACDLAPAILELSDVVLAQRETLSRLEARQFGAGAAYLKIVYGALSSADAEALLDLLAEGQVRTVEDLAAARLIATLGPDRALDILAPAVAETPTLLFGISTMRALVLADAGALLIDRLAALPPEQSSLHFTDLVVALLDQPDEIKQDLLRRAAAGGMPLLAAGFAATQLSPKGWKVLLGTISDPIDIAHAAKVWSTAAAAVGNSRLVASSGASDPQIDAMLHDIVRVAAKQPESEFLLTFVNYTGDLAEAHAAGTALETRLMSGTIDRKGPFDAVWLAAYELLVKATGDRDRVDGFLAAAPYAPVRLQRANVGDALDWIVAVDALTPYLKGESDTLPPVPADRVGTLTASWPEWTALARAVRETHGATPRLAINDASLPKTAELLLAAGKVQELAALLADAPPSLNTVATAEDFAKRLDRACKAFLWHPGESVLLIGRPIYKFD